MNKDGHIENDIGGYDPIECVCRVKENEHYTSANKFHTDFCTNTCMFHALREDKNYGLSTMTNESIQSLNSPFESRKSLSMIQERDTETDTEKAPKDNYYLKLEMSLETELRPRNIFDDIDSNFISPASSIVETTSVAKLKSESSRVNLNSSPDHDEQSVLDTVKNEIKDFLISSNSNDSPSNEGMLANSLFNEMKQTDIKKNKYSNITLKELEIKGMPCKEVEVGISPIRIVQITSRDPGNQKSKESTGEVKMNRSSELSNDNQPYESKANTEIMKVKCVEEPYITHYSSNTHPSIEELYKAKCLFTDKRSKINRNIKTSK